MVFPSGDHSGPPAPFARSVRARASPPLIASTKILRDDFGIDFNMPLGVDKFALGKKIDVEIDAQFTAPQA